MLQIGEPVWMPEVGLGMGRQLLPIGGLEQDGLSWFAADGSSYLSSEEVADQAEQERDRLAAKLRELGIDPEKI